MNKLNVIGLDLVKKDLIKELMDLGVVEIVSQSSKLTNPDWISYIEKDGNEQEVSNLDTRISTINLVLEHFNKYDKTKKPMFSTRDQISSKKFQDILKNKENIENNMESIFKHITNLSELKTEENKIKLSMMTLEPWKTYQIPLDITETKYTSVFMGVVPNIVSVEDIKNDIKEITNKFIIDLISTDKDQNYLSVICMKDEKEEIYNTLKKHSFSVVTFKDLNKTVAENIIDYENLLSDINKRTENIELEITNSVVYSNEIKYLYDYLIMERDKNKIVSSMLRTNKTFYFSGWIIEKSKEDVEKILLKHECWYEIKEPDKDEVYPIMLNNNSFAQPFESITELYSLPSYSNIDPTAAMAPFYFLFFGLMLADVGYGLIMSAICFTVLKKFKIEGTLKKMVKMFFYCGISTAFWGVMFGSWFGDAIPAATKLFFNSDFNIEPIWISPMKEPMTLLIFSFIFGAIHLFVGMGIQAYMLIKDGKVLDALFDIGLWYILIIGLGLLLFGESIIIGSGAIGKWMSIIGAIGLVLTQGRSKKNIIGKLLSGVMSLYNITGYLSDILSYSRLLALGLATSVISSVVSILGTMGGKSFFGIIIFALVLTVGHVFNFAINALGAFVHSARLQYVEFFGKFYEGGGEAFNPLIKKTKYINIIEEEI